MIIFCATENPGIVDSTTNALIPRVPAARSVFAYTNNTSAIGPFVMKIFRPFNTNSSPSRTAVVAIDPNASDPAPGSVNANAPTADPSHSPGRYRRRCSAFALR